MKYFRLIIAILLLIPCSLWAKTYQGSLQKTTEGNITHFHWTGPANMTDDDVLLVTEGNTQNVAVLKGSKAAKLLWQFAKSGGAEVVQYKDYVWITSGVYPFVDQISYKHTKKMLSRVSEDQAKVLQINADNSALMVGIRK